MRLTEQVHNYLEKQLCPGDLVIDATAGNGYDCLKIAQRIAPTGKLIAIDRQPQAIESSCNRLKAHNLEKLCQFIEANHADALPAMVEKHTGQVASVIFNLGYLPGSDKSIRTTPADTLLALDAAKSLLQPEGLLLVTAYRGHEGGLAEAEAVAHWMNQFSGTVLCHEPSRSIGGVPPILWVARMAAEPDLAVFDVTPENRPKPAGK